MKRTLYSSLLILFFVLPALLTFSSERGASSSRVKGFTFSSYSDEGGAKQKIKFNTKMKAGLVIGIIGLANLNNALSSGIATSILWSLTSLTTNSIKNRPMDGYTALAVWTGNLSFLISAIATAIYGAFSLVIGLVFTIVGFSVLTVEKRKQERVGMLFSYEESPALAFRIRL